MQKTIAPEKSRLRKFTELSSKEKLTLVLAANLMPVYWLGLKAFGIKRFSKMVFRPHSKISATVSIEELCALGRIVNAAATYTIGPNNCLVRSFVLQSLVSKRGISSDLRIGFLKKGNCLEAHAWVEKDGVPINDSPDVTEKFNVFEGAIHFSSFSKP